MIRERLSHSKQRRELKNKAEDLQWSQDKALIDQIKLFEIKEKEAERKQKMESLEKAKQVLVDAEKQKRLEAERRELERLEDIKLSQEYSRLLDEQDAKREGQLRAWGEKYAKRTGNYQEAVFTKSKH